MKLKIPRSKIKFANGPNTSALSSAFQSPRTDQEDEHGLKHERSLKAIDVSTTSEWFEKASTPRSTNQEHDLKMKFAVVRRRMMDNPE